MGCCDECVYGKYVGGGDYICENENSEAYGLETTFDDCCDEYESRGYDED